MNLSIILYSYVLQYGGIDLLYNLLSHMQKNLVLSNWQIRNLRVMALDFVNIQTINTHLSMLSKFTHYVNWDEMLCILALISIFEEY